MEIILILKIVGIITLSLFEVGLLVLAGWVLSYLICPHGMSKFDRWMLGYKNED
jgi:hypothetical protein